MDSALNGESGPMASPSTPSRRLNKKERFKMISQITLLDTTMEGKLSVSLKIEDCSFVDDNSLSLLSMPDGPFMTKEPFKPTFHSFVITVQNGQRIYGGSYIFGLRQMARNDESDEHKVVYLSRALVALTIRPLVNQLKKLLEWCVIEGGCNPRWLRCLANIPLPAKGKCIMIHLPDIKNINKGRLSVEETNIVINSPARIGECVNISDPHSANIVSIFRPFSIFPLFDYSFRYLLTEVMTIENLVWIYACALNELQILISSSSYYKLMLIAECITCLLNPFKWQHVYVPILPTKLGLHYLDAPTPFIMGINSRHQNLVKTNKIACFVDCDRKQFELNVENATFVAPPFSEDLRMELQAILNSDPRLSSSNVPSSDALKRVSQLAHKYNVIVDHFSYLDEIQLNQKIRIVFFRKLKKMILNKYQHYIGGGGDKEQAKFDAVSYLSDQPSSLRPFLQHFIETQMFATFIDEVGKSIGRKQSNFYSDANLVESMYEDDAEDDLTIYSDKVIQARFHTAQQINLIDLEELTAVSNNVAGTMSPCRKRIQTAAGGIKVSDKAILASPLRNASTAITAQTNWKVVETLLKEVKLKTKRILLVKMGSDEIGNTSHGVNGMAGNVEENTLIAALCDLIERIWSHARSDNESSRAQSSNACPFWSHLTAFHQCCATSNSQPQVQLNGDSRPSTPEHSSSTWLQRRIDSLSQLSLVDQSPRSLLPKGNALVTRCIPSTLSHDYQSICQMSDIKTDVGKSRAFIRLSLERKLLSKHLRALLYKQELLQSSYKRYAFLRCEEEREQFLTHLLTLNAVDLPCFTNTFTTTQLSYTMVIGATVQFNGHLHIVGSHGDTPTPIAFNSNVITFAHTNFGFISLISLRVASNEKVYIENVFIRNNITNCLYRFECNKWLGKNIDDGSLERFMVADIVHGSINDHLNNRSSQARSSSIGRNWSRSSANDNRDGGKCSIEDLQTMLGESVNQIVKLYFGDRNKSQCNDAQTKHKLNSKLPSSSSCTLSKMSKVKSQAPSRTMISLLFGEKKFLWIITQIFYFGFKNRRSFRKQNFIWDFVGRVQAEIKITTDNKGSQFVQEFITLVEAINDKAPSYGKDLKFELFILLSLRDQKLSPYYLKLLSRASLCSLYYESESFLRDSVLYVFLSQILKSFNEIELKLDHSITKGL